MLRAKGRLFLRLGFACGLVAACTTLPPSELLVACGDDPDCPAAFICGERHICVRGTATQSAPVVSNAGTDAPAMPTAADGADAAVPRAAAIASAPPPSPGAGAAAAPVSASAGTAAPPMAASAGAPAAAGVCVANERSCQQSVLRTCKVDQSGYDSTPCAYGCQPDGLRCNLCSPEEHQCSGACVSNTSVDSCGMRCSPCLTGGRSVTTCVNGQCGLACDTDTFQCKQSAFCVPRRLDFEAGLDSWTTVQSSGSTGQEPPTRSMDVVHGGSYAARSLLDVSGDRHAYQFLGPLCSDEGLDLRGVTATFWVYIAPNGSAAGVHDCDVYGFDLGSVSIVAGAQRTTIPENHWTRLIGTVSNDAAGANAGVVGFGCSIATNSANWSGAIYIDDITFE